jgi:mono/diheme cytochrome c family protein
MTTIHECQPTKIEIRRRLSIRLAIVLGFVLSAGSGCRQKMAEQPYYRPYESCDFFDSDGQGDVRSARPLERGVIHRGQYLETDPLVTGLTREEWGRIYSREGVPPNPNLAAPTPIENRNETYGAPRFDPPGFEAAKYGGVAHDSKGGKIYVDEYPFAITQDDLKRGQERFTIYCAVCHGPLGNGQGKIWERGYLTPTSFHTRLVGEHEMELEHPRDLPLGYSRGYSLWGIKIPLREVPVGYIFEVITKGFAGMPSYSAQIPPADRWKIIAYVRALQLSQHAPNSLVNAGGKQ